MYNICNIYYIYIIYNYVLMLYNIIIYTYISIKHIYILYFNTTYCSINIHMYNLYITYCIFYI